MQLYVAVRKVGRELRVVGAASLKQAFRYRYSKLNVIVPHCRVIAQHDVIILEADELLLICRVLDLYVIQGTCANFLEVLTRALHGIIFEYVSSALVVDSVLSFDCYIFFVLCKVEVDGLKKVRQLEIHINYLRVEQHVCR